LKVFRIEDGAVVGGSLKANVARNEFLCTTRQYGNFELRLKVKLLGKGANGGVQIRSRRVPNHHEVSGYQADMADGWWGKLYDESRRNRVLAGPSLAEQKKIVKPGEWNDYVIRCEGRRIRLWLNGQPTVDYAEPDASLPQTGIIGLQIHGGPPSEAWYKDIMIRELHETYVPGSAVMNTAGDTPKYWASRTMFVLLSCLRPASTALSVERGMPVAADNAAWLTSFDSIRCANICPGGLIGVGYSCDSYCSTSATSTSSSSFSARERCGRFIKSSTLRSVFRYDCAPWIGRGVYSCSNC
jgi:hypothetical protein